MEELYWAGNVSFTQEEFNALEKAVDVVLRSYTSCGIYRFLEKMPGYPAFFQYQIDAYLEAKGLKSPDIIIPPLTLVGGYELDERGSDKGSVLPSWWKRGDGAILYLHRWWGTESPAEGWREYAWFQVESALKYEQVSEWKPIGHYMHKRKYWHGELEEGPLGPRRQLYSIIVKRGEIDLG